MPGQCHCRHIGNGRQLSQLLQQLITIHFRHRNIRNHQIEILAPRDLKRFGAASFNLVSVEL